MSVPLKTIEGTNFFLKVETKITAQGGGTLSFPEVGFNIDPRNPSAGIRINTNKKILPLYLIWMQRDNTTLANFAQTTSAYSAFSSPGVVAGSIVNEFYESLITTFVQENKSPANATRGNVGFINSKYSDSLFKKCQSGILLNFVSGGIAQTLSPTGGITQANAYTNIFILHYAEMA